MLPRRLAFLRPAAPLRAGDHLVPHHGAIQRARPLLRPIASPSRAARIVTTCCTEKPPSNSQTSESSDTGKGPSRTLLGRIIVEVLSLIVGAFLLLVVLVWRAYQMISTTAWRALTWLSNVRQLGKWAVKRLADVDNVVVPVASFRRAISRAYGFAIEGLTRVGQENSADPVVESPVVDEKTGPEADLEDDVQEATPVTDASEVKPAVAAGRRLILLRHAKTMWDKESETPDHDRVLSTKGKEEARLVGSELARLSWVPDVVLCSDAVRTVQTLSLLDMPEKSPGATTCTESLYYAVTGEEMAVAVDEALGDKGFAENTTLMVVCHNPGCEELVEQLTGHRPEMGTGCAALLEYDGDEEPDDESGNVAHFSLSPQQKQWSLVQLIRPSTMASSYYD